MSKQSAKFQFEIKSGEKKTVLDPKELDPEEPTLGQSNKLALPKEVIEVLRVKEGYFVEVELKKDGQVQISKRAGKQQGLFDSDPKTV